MPEFPLRLGFKPPCGGGRFAGGIRRRRAPRGHRREALVGRGRRRRFVLRRPVDGEPWAGRIEPVAALVTIHRLLDRFRVARRASHDCTPVSPCLADKAARSIKGEGGRGKGEIGQWGFVICHLSLVIGDWSSGVCHWPMTNPQ